MRDLALLVPSRGRPASIARLWDALTKTCQGDTTLIVGLDDDDPALAEYFALGAGPGLDCEYEVQRDLRGVVAWFNYLAAPRAGQYRFLGALADDNLPQTPGWDVQIMEALERTPFAFGNDLSPRPPGEFCTHIFCRSEVVTALGYLAMPAVKHMYCDAIWLEWGKAAGITCLHQVNLEHLHYSTGKSPLDATYAASAPLMGPDKVAFDAYCADPDGLAADIRKIKAVL
jgi:hypothetical protein